MRRNGGAYPRILQPGELRALNERVFAQLRVPLFFVTPEPARPCATTAVGQLYEIVLGLYALYHDYGFQLLTEFRGFCGDRYETMWPEFQSDYAVAVDHFRKISVLRTGLCHGMMPGSMDARDFVQTLKRCLQDTQNQQAWPGYPAGLEENSCRMLIDHLSQESDRVCHFLEDCAGNIASSGALLSEFQQTMAARVFNDEAPQYGSGRTYFNMRVVEALTKGRRIVPIQPVLKNWLEQLRPEIQNGTLRSASAPFDRLREALDSAYTESRPRVPSSRLLGADLDD